MEQPSVTIYFDGSPVVCDPSKSILDNLLDNKIRATFSCKKGSCLTCVLRTQHSVTPDSQASLKPTLVEQGYFLSCQAMPVEGMEVLSSEQDKLFSKAIVKEINHLSGHVAQVFITPDDNFSYIPGQFLNIKGPDDEVRSYSMASTGQHPKDTLELHIKKHKYGKVSGWLGDEVQVNDEVYISGPNGSCFYISGQPEQPLLLVGTGTGLAPLLGIIRHAIKENHKGKIKLYHGAVEEDGLYLSDELKGLAAKHSNIEITLGVLIQGTDKGLATGPINEIALAQQPDLKGWRVYLCGDPQMVQTTKQKSFLAGASLSDILSDPFEIKTPE